MLTPVGLRPPSVSKTEPQKNNSLSLFFRSHIIDKCTFFINEKRRIVGGLRGIAVYGIIIISSMTA